MFFVFSLKSRWIPSLLIPFLASLVVPAVSSPQAVVVSRAGTERSLLTTVSRLAWQTLIDPAQVQGTTVSVRADVAPFCTSCGMDERMVSLFLQSYNAGPYAVTRFHGKVPYRETRAYTQKVMRFYRMDLSNTPYDEMIVRSASRHRLDAQLIRAMMKAESDFRNRTVSRAGARGLMQVMPVTWNEVRKRNGITWNYSAHVFDPAKNIEVACAYLSWIRYEHLPKHFAEFRNPMPGSEQPQGFIASLRALGGRQTASVEPRTNGRTLPGAVINTASASASGGSNSGIRFSWSGN
jgi:hypothetical protein